METITEDDESQLYGEANDDDDGIEITMNRKYGAITGDQDL